MRALRSSAAIGPEAATTCAMPSAPPGSTSAPARKLPPSTAAAQIDSNNASRVVACSSASLVATSELNMRAMRCDTRSASLRSLMSREIARIIQRSPTRIALRRTSM